MVASATLYQDDYKEVFLNDMAHLCAKETLHIIIIGGDFNIIRGPHEKKNSNYNDRWLFLFNAIIDAFNM